MFFLLSSLLVFVVFIVIGFRSWCEFVRIDERVKHVRGNFEQTEEYVRNERVRWIVASSRNNYVS
jgi:hypothetical protein